MKRIAGIAVLGALMGCAGPPVTSHSGLEKALLLEQPELGDIGGIHQLPDGTVVVAGDRGAAWVSADGRVTDVAKLDVPCSSEERRRRTPTHVEPVVWQEDLAFLSRGGNWHEVGVYDATGEFDWGYSPETGPNWLTATDLDGDDRLDFVVGMNGDGGLARITPDGDTVWHVDEGNVWRVEAIQADADPEYEIIHSNAMGQLWLRDSTGEILQEIETEAYIARNFDVALSDGVPTWMVYGSDSALVVATPGEEAVVRLETAFDRTAGSFAVAARQAPPGSDGAPWSYLAALSDSRTGGLAMLEVYDGEGRPILDDVPDQSCGAIAWIETVSGPSLWMGCRGRVWAYSHQHGDEAPRRPARQFFRSGDALGAASFGDSPSAVHHRLRSDPQFECIDDCKRWWMQAGDTRYAVVPVFETADDPDLEFPDAWEHDDAGLSRFLVIGIGQPEKHWETRVRRDWTMLIALLAHPADETPRADWGDAVEGALSRPRHETHRWTSETRSVVLGLYGYERAGADELGAIALIGPGNPETAAPSVPAKRD